MRSAVTPLLARSLLVMALGASAAAATTMPALVPPVLTLESLPRPAVPPAERGPVVPSQVLRWRQEAQALEHGDGGIARDPVRAAQLYCRAARYGDAEAQYSLAWMLTNSRGIERDDAQAAHLFAAAAEQGIEQAKNMLASMGTPRGDPPACLRPPDTDPPPLAAAPVAPAARARLGQAGQPGLAPNALAFLPPPANAPEPIVRFVKLVAPDYQLQPQLVLAVMATESNFDPLAVSPKNAQGLMQLMPDTASRFQVRKLTDPAQNIRGGMAYLRWLLAYFEGDLALVLAAYNAGERAVERYRGVPPYAETRHYVRRIIASLGGVRSHPFDPKVTPPSDVLPLLRKAAR
ncbi:transglycosylase SLT domain-containing protein [Aquincola sp. S2]|uniref:Transglycosylase SLT domain-containing protein n=1 Tax=Pseudaquabacterium terrae TaxID=2732868 RepID=A0ABX2EHL7_9BURK|nr:transglycosylase SLT domain-containing protein [Aquabacterium terrae]NRF68120.1 transglycosylase SLT domain-containing protein [Aquabacterium terrae]